MTSEQTIVAEAPANPVWPVIAVGKNVTVGREDTNSIRIQHASISRKHLRLALLDGGQVEIEDLDSRFGTFVNGARIKKSLLKAGDTVRIGSSPPYRFNGTVLEAALDGSGMTIRLAGVGMVRDGRKLIEGINLTIPQDSFVGVLGPSGAGKSLMLGMLSSTMLPTTGTIEFDDGLPVADNLDYYRSKIGIVTQDDIVYTDLTVDENLSFAALIRLPHVTDAERGGRCASALEAVGLLEHRTKRVSVLSGGQRKRVSVAIELLLQPRLLLLDEPTSGLDPGMQARLMEMLRGLARRGVTVVCTTHTLDTLNFFDQLLVLGLKDRVASVAYFGSPRELLPAFGVHTQMDLFDKLQQLGGSTPAEREAAAEPPTDDTGTTRRRSRRASIRIEKPPPGKELILEQAKVVFRRAYLGLTRDPVSKFMALAQPPILAMLVALSQANQMKSLAIIFFTAVCTIWLGMTLTVREIVRERKLYIRDRLAGLHPDAYLLGKVMYASAVVLVQGTIMWFIIRFIAPAMVREDVGNRISDTNMLMGWIIVLITGLGASLLGLLVSTLAKSERTAVTLLPLVLLPMVVLSRVTYGDIRKEWHDPSPYCSMLDFVTGKALGGGQDNPDLMPRTERENRANQKKLSEQSAQIKRFMPAFEPPAEPPPFKEPGAFGRGMNFLISSPMLTRPSAAALDMLGAKDDEASAGMVCFELFYLLVLVGGYGGLLYWLFHTYEKTWNDIRSA